MSVAHIMQEQVVTVSPDTSIADALDTMADNEIRHLPITAAGKLLGIVSDRDLREYQTPLAEALGDPDAARQRLAVAVADAMATDLIYADVEEDISAVVDLMLEYKVGAVPVVDRTTLKLLGIVSYVDVLRLFRRELDG